MGVCICEVEHGGDHPWCPSCHPESVTAPDTPAELDAVERRLYYGPMDGETVWLAPGETRLNIDWFPDVNDTGRLSGYYQPDPYDPAIWMWHLVNDTRRHE